MAVTRIALLAIACILGISASYALPSSRILGGEDAAVGQFKWVASVRLDNTHACTGSIVKSNFILTAAHCCSQLGASPVAASRLTARVGSINQFASGQIVSVSSVEIHPSYANFLHDVCLLRLSADLEFNDKIGAIEMADAEEELDEGTEVTVTGWGLQETGASPYKLQHATYTVLGSAECELQAGYGYDSVLCLQHAVNRGVCSGDGGAPCVVNNKLVGVISFAFGSCGTKYPDIASKASYYNDWLNEKIL